MDEDKAGGRQSAGGETKQSSVIHDAGAVWESQDTADYFVTLSPGQNERPDSATRPQPEPDKPKTVEPIAGENGGRRADDADAMPFPVNAPHLVNAPASNYDAVRRIIEELGSEKLPQQDDPHQNEASSFVSGASPSFSAPDSGVKPETAQSLLEKIMRKSQRAASSDEINGKPAPSTKAPTMPDDPPKDDIAPFDWGETPSRPASDSGKLLFHFGETPDGESVSAAEVPPALNDQKKDSTADRAREISQTPRAGGLSDPTPESAPPKKKLFSLNRDADTPAPIGLPDAPTATLEIPAAMAPKKAEPALSVETFDSRPEYEVRYHKVSEEKKRRGRVAQILFTVFVMAMLLLVVYSLLLSSGVLPASGMPEDPPVSAEPGGTPAGPDAESILREADGVTYLRLAGYEVVYVNREHAVPADFANGMDVEAEAAFKAMQAAAQADGVTIWAVSGYRSVTTETSLRARYIEELGQERTDAILALPGHSEHQLGLAYDFGGAQSGVVMTEDFKDTAEYAWLRARAHEFGFIERYPQGKEDVTGYDYSPWHFRYVGRDLATLLQQSGQTLEEYAGRVVS